MPPVYLMGSFVGRLLGYIFSITTQLAVLCQWNAALAGGWP
jgi:hypothetical protein